jgi:hypothetical protein
MEKVDEKILEQFPDYNGQPKDYVGSKDYWKAIFSWEKNRNPELHKAFSELHHKIVNEVIEFCKKYDLDVDEFSVKADGLLGSKPYGKWTSATDSSMAMYNFVHDEELNYNIIDRKNPFLYEI